MAKNMYTVFERRTWTDYRSTIVHHLTCQFGKGTLANSPLAWWLFNGVAGRLTLEPLPRCDGPTSLVFMGRDLRRRTRALAEALQLPPGAVVDANASGSAAFGGGVARGLCGGCE